MAKETLPSSNKPKPTKLSPSLHHHPPYLQMISEAISSLKDRTGSSHPAIAKFIEEKYKSSLPPNFKKMLSVQLKKFAKSGKLVKIKNSYKMSVPEKAAKKVGLDAEEKKKKTSEASLKTGVGQEEKMEKKMNRVGVKSQLKAKKMKRLSQVSTPSALKKKKKKVSITPRKIPKTIKSPKAAAKKLKKGKI